MKKLRQEAGFTLTEVMIVVAIILIIVAIAGPNLVDFVPRKKMRSAARELKSNLEMARIEAVKNHRPVVISFPSSGQCSPFSPGGSYQMFIDKNKNGILNAPEDKYVELFGGGNGLDNSTKAKYEAGSSVAICPPSNNLSFHFTSRGFLAQGKTGTTPLSTALVFNIKSTYSSGGRNPGLNVTLNSSGGVSIKND